MDRTECGENTGEQGMGEVAGWPWDRGKTWEDMVRL